MHKVYLGVAPEPIKNLFNIVNSHQRRRRLIIFEKPFNRLKTSDNTICFRGPVLYNHFTNEMNENIPENFPRLQNRFLNLFKSSITRDIVHLQKLGDENQWSTQNFAGATSQPNQNI